MACWLCEARRRIERCIVDDVGHVRERVHVGNAAVGPGPERVDSPSALYQPYGGGYVGHQQTHMNHTHVNAQQHRMATPPVPQSPKKAAPKKQSKKSAKAAAKAEKRRRLAAERRAAIA